MRQATEIISAVVAVLRMYGQELPVVDLVDRDLAAIGVIRHITFNVIDDLVSGKRFVVNLKSLDVAALAFDGRDCSFHKNFLAVGVFEWGLDAFHSTPGGGSPQLFSLAVGKTPPRGRPRVWPLIRCDTGLIHGEPGEHRPFGGTAF